MGAFKEEAERKLKKLSGEDGSDDFDQLEFGKNPRRFFPRPGIDQFFLETTGHYLSGQWLRCLTTSFTGKNSSIPALDTVCPACRRFNRERIRVNRKFKRGSDEGKEAYKAVAKEWGPKVQYFANVCNPDEDEPEIKTLRFGPQLLTCLLTEYVDANVEFFHPRRGRTMIIKKTKTGPDTNNVEYTVIRGERRQDITEAWEQVKGQLPDLDAAAGEIMTSEEMEKLITATDVAYSGDEPDVEQKYTISEVARDTEGRRNGNGAGIKKAKKPPCFGDPDTHDPKDEVCHECAYFEPCKETEDVAEAYAEGRYKPKKKPLRIVEREAD